MRNLNFWLYSRWLWTFLVLCGTHSLQGQQLPIIQTCTLSNYQPSGGHAIWLDQIPGSSNPRYNFDANGGLLVIYSDSTAHITGRVVHISQSARKWDLDMWLINIRDYNAWTALGRDYKVEQAPLNVVNANKQDWYFWEMDSTRSRMYGVPGSTFDGDTLILSHNPPDFEFGFQFGLGANAKNASYGMSGWFKYTGAYTGHGDINVNASCSSYYCDASIDALVTQCLTDSTFSVTAQISGTGNDWILSDNQGSPVQDSLGTGSYLVGIYPNGTLVEVYLLEPNVILCGDTASVTADCTPAPCALDVQVMDVPCVTATTFGITLAITGTGTQYELRDLNGTLLLGPVAPGTYVAGSFASGTTGTIIVRDLAQPACADTVTATGTCVIPCEVAIDTVVAVCGTGQTFMGNVTISGNGTQYQLSDNQNSPVLFTPQPGTYTFGPYTSGTQVVFTVTADSACTDTAAVSLTCPPPPPPCQVTIDSVTTVCGAGQTFMVSVSFSGNAPFYQISDNQSPTSQIVSNAGTYLIGPYPSGTPVVVMVSAGAGCEDTAHVTAVCAPPVCDVALLPIYTLCVTDSGFEVIVTITGSGSNYTLTDDQGSPALTGLSAGTYNLGPYLNSIDVMVTVSDPAFSGSCTQTDGPVTADCTPVPLCDVQTDSLYTQCVSDSTFLVGVVFTGSGTNYTLAGGGISLSGLVPGTYFLGPFSNNTPVHVTYTDPGIFGCVRSAGDTVTADCAPPPPPANYVCEQATELTCQTTIQATTADAGNADAPAGCSAPNDGSGVWFSLMGNGEIVTLSTCGSGKYIDTRINVYKGDCEALICVAGNDDTPKCAQGLSEVSFKSSPNTRYLIYVSTASETGSKFTLDVSCAPSVKVGPLYPNPSTDLIYADAELDEPGMMRWVIYDVRGVPVSEGFQYRESGYHVIEVPMTDLPADVYMVRFYHREKQISHQKAVKLP
ncbi:MAG: hypothetical protein SF053_15440 [Bacteroidia bacterium]|nr:hypothetical protein [Bacteroidia bacterium]